METNQFSPEETGNGMTDPGKQPRLRKGVLILCVCAALLLTAFLVLNFAFTVRYEQIDVQLQYDATNPILEPQYSVRDVLELAGIRGSFLSFTEDPERISKAINQDHRFACSEVRLTANTLRIVVRQRQRRAYMDAGGVLFMIDEDGMILERCGTQRADDRLILVEGMMPTNPQVGELLMSNKKDQLTAYQEVLFQLTDLRILNRFDTLNVRDPDDIYMTTRDGYTIHLGDRGDLRKKVKTVYIVLQTLDSCVTAARQEGNQENLRKYASGILEVLEPGKIVYSPIN